MIAMGFDDSKALDEKTRDGLFQRMLRTHAQLGWVIHSIPATELAGKMLMKEPTSLNKISHDSAADMISLVLAEGVCVTEVFVDTVGDPEMYQKKLEGLFAHHSPRISFVVAKKADSLYKTVSAASIAAKVTRDRAISGWVWEEGFKSEAPLTNFGSGYPGDARCSDWLKGNSDGVFGFPSLVRFSWSTARDLMEKECVKVEWEEDEDDQGLPAGTASIEAFIRPKPGAPKKARKRAKYFQTRGMETVGDF
jgi:ribonuclease H2 subunit A